VFAAPDAKMFLRHRGAGCDHPPRPDRRENGDHPYLKRRRGANRPNYLHPSLEPVLKRARWECRCFRNSLLRMAMIAAGFTGGEAEELRRAFGFKRSEVRMKSVEEAARRHGTQRNWGEVQDNASFNRLLRSRCMDFPNRTPRVLR
jgi:DNA polymerase III alpha subunit